MRADPAPRPSAPLAALPTAFVIVVGDAGASALAAAITTARTVGAIPILVVGAASGTPLGSDIVAVTPPGAGRAGRGHEDAGASALRHGLSRLANARVTGALLATAAPDLAAPPDRLRALLAAAGQTGAELAVPRYLGGRCGPVYAGRDAWREIVTHPAGLQGVLAARERAVLEVDVSV